MSSPSTPRTPPPAATPVLPSLSSRVQFLRAAAVVAAAVGAVLASGEPTGVGIWDTILRALFAAVVTFAGSRADPWAILALAVVPILLAWPSPWIVCGLLAAVIVLQYLRGKNWVIQLERTDVALSACAVALAMQVVLRMNQGPFFGAASLLAGVLVLGVLVTAWLRSSPRSRRFSGFALAGLATLLALIVFGSVVSLPAGRDAAADGIYSAERGLKAARAGDVEEADRYLNLADQSFSNASDRFDSIWARPGRLVPVLSQHLRALQVASVHGSALASAGKEVAQSVDLSTVMRADGGLDIDQLRDAAPRLANALQVLDVAQTDLEAVDSPWLLPALSTRLESATTELADSTEQAQLAAAAASSAPTVLGADQTQHYLVIFGSPSEARELGGLLTNWALIEINSGSIERLASGRWQDLQDEAAIHGGLDHPFGYPDFYTVTDPAGTPSNITGLPSITDVARATVDIFPTLRGESIEGVIYVDPAGLAALLAIVGPVQPSDTSMRLTAGNAVDYLLRDQYERFPDVAERHRVLDDLINQVFGSLGSVKLPGPARLSEVFGPAGRGRHLQMATFDDEVNDFLRSIDLLQDFERANDQDFLSVTGTNLLSNKLDAWVDRTINYNASVDAVSGQVDGLVTITLTSRATDRLPRVVLGPQLDGIDPGVHITDVVVWTPHQLLEVRVDGEPSDSFETDHYSLNRYSVGVSVPPGESRELEIRLAGRLESAAAYELMLMQYPGANVDTMEVLVQRSDGALIDQTFPLEEDTTLSLPILSARAPS